MSISVRLRAAILGAKRSYSCSSGCLVSATLPAAEQYLRLVSFCSLQQAGRGDVRCF